MPPASVTGVVLCGGASRRMGDDKACLELGGEDLLARAIGVLAPHVAEVVLACGEEERYAERGLRLALDTVQGGGALAGVEAALAAARTEWVLVIACDMPFAGVAVRDLLHAVQDEDDLVHYVVDGRPEPLCVLYRATALTALRAALERGERKANSFWGELRARALQVDDPTPFRNLNTPEDLSRARSESA